MVRLADSPDAPGDRRRSLVRPFQRRRSVDALVHGPTSIMVFWPRTVTGETYASDYAVRRDGQLIATMDALNLLEPDLVPGSTYEYSVRSVTFDGRRSEPEVPLTVTTPTR